MRVAVMTRPSLEQQIDIAEEAVNEAEDRWMRAADQGLPASVVKPLRLKYERAQAYFDGLIVRLTRGGSQ